VKLGFFIKYGNHEKFGAHVIVKTHKLNNLGFRPIKCQNKTKHKIQMSECDCGPKPTVFGQNLTDPIGHATDRIGPGSGPGPGSWVSAWLGCYGLSSMFYFMLCAHL